MGDRPLDVQDRKPSHVSSSSTEVYIPGNLKAVAEWTYIAYLYLHKVHLRYLDHGVSVGTVGFATNNPGSLDYLPNSPQAGPALRVAGLRGAYLKNTVAKLYARFAVFPYVQLGMDAVIPMLKEFGGGESGTSTVEAALLAYKGIERDHSDWRLLHLPEDWTPAQKNAAVRADYTSNIRYFLRSALHDQGVPDSDLDQRIESIMKTPVRALENKGQDATAVRSAILSKESSRNLPGVVYQKGELEVSLDGRSKAELDVINKLLDRRDDVKKELDAILAQGPAE